MNEIFFPLILGNVLSCSRVSSLILEKVHSWFLDGPQSGRSANQESSTGLSDNRIQHDPPSHTPSNHSNANNPRSYSNTGSNSSSTSHHHVSAGSGDKSLMKRKICTAAESNGRDAQSHTHSSSYSNHGKGDEDRDYKEYILKKGRKGHTSVVPQSTASLTPTGASLQRVISERGLSSPPVDSNDASMNHKSVKFFQLNQPPSPATTEESWSFQQGTNNTSKSSTPGTPFLATPRDGHATVQGYAHSRSAEILSAKTTVSMAIADSMIDNILGNNVSLLQLSIA